jgi:hypothetical protein
MFLVERPTPGRFLGPGQRENAQQSLKQALPFELEICDEPEARGTTYTSICRCKSVFRLSDDAVRWLKSRQMYRRVLNGRPNPCVCLCMGRVV